MDKYMMGLLCFQGYVLAVNSGCIWESEENKNIVGQYLDTFDGTISTCLERCDLNAGCKSVDHGIENGVEKCQLNSVTRTEAIEYTSSEGVTHYFCIFDGSTEQPYGGLTTEQQPVGQISEKNSNNEFYDWLRDNQEYFILICFGILIFLLFLTIIILLCCYVTKSSAISSTPGALGLSPIYEEADELVQRKSTVNNNDLLTDNIADTSPPYVQDNPIYHPSGVTYTEVSHLDKINLNLNSILNIDEINVEAEPDSIYTEPQLLSTTSNTVTTSYENVRYSPSVSQDAISEISGHTENQYEQPVPIPPPSPPPLPPTNM